MAGINQSRLQELVTQLYAVTDELEQMFPTRHFTLDGHLVGSLGECLVADAYGLTLMPASNKGFDAVDKLGHHVEIKATQAGNRYQRVAFRHQPDYAIVVKLFADGSFEEIYNGSGALIWQEFADKKLPSNGQYQISLSKLARLNQLVEDKDRVGK